MPSSLWMWNLWEVMISLYSSMTWRLVFFPLPVDSRSISTSRSSTSCCSFSMVSPTHLQVSSLAWSSGLSFSALASPSLE